MHRDRGQTEQRLIDAVGRIIAKEGYDRVKINRIATEAGVNKILIYRYFGGLPGLIQAYVQQVRLFSADFPLDANQLKTLPLEAIFDACCDYLLTEYQLLRHDAQALGFLKAELLHQSVPESTFLIERSKQFQAIIKLIGSRSGTSYAPIYANFMHSALTMLTLLGQSGQTQLGVDLGSDESWEQIETVVRHLFRGIYLHCTQQHGDQPVGDSGEKPA